MHTIDAVITFQAAIFLLHMNAVLNLLHSYKNFGTYLGVGFALAIIKPATKIISAIIGGFRSVVTTLDIHSLEMDMDSSVGNRNRDCK